MQDVMKKLEKTFFHYTNKYDQNIKSIIKERGLEISNEELEEVLSDAKNRL